MVSVVYQIRLKGQLDAEWSDWFLGMTVVPEASGDTLITGPVCDQAALHGLLKKVRDLGMPLVSVARCQPDAKGTRMEEHIVSNRRLARFAGLVYLGNILTGVFSEVVVRSGIIVAGNAELTARNILASELLYRAGLVSDLMMTSFFLLMGWAFHRLLKPVSAGVARLMLLFNIAGVSIMALNLLNYFAPLLLLGGADFLKVFSVPQLQALALLFAQLHHHGYLIAAISFGVYLAPLGFLVYKSGFLPRVLGILLMVAAAAFVIDMVTQFLFPALAASISAYVLIPTVIGEFAFCLWLLIRGAKPTPALAQKENM